jgi:hypothetical protein
MTMAAVTCEESEIWWGPAPSLHADETWIAMQGRMAGACHCWGIQRRVRVWVHGQFAHGLQHRVHACCHTNSNLEGALVSTSMLASVLRPMHARTPTLTRTPNLQAHDACAHAL